MKANKLLLFVILLTAILAYLGFSGFFEESANINIYNDGSLIIKTLSINKEQAISLPFNLVESSLYIKPKGANLISVEIKKVGELEGNIGKKIKIYFKDKEIEGTLLDVKGMLYIKTKDGVLVVNPDAYVLEKTDSMTQAYLKFDKKPENTIISYQTSGIKWKANHKLFLNEGSGKLETFSFIKNNDNIEYKGSVKLIADELNVMNYGIYNGIYNQIYKSARESISSTPSNYVIPKRSDKTITYDLGKRSFEPKSDKMIKIEEGNFDYKRVLLYETSLQQYSYSNKKENLRNTILFKAPYDLAKGEVFVYGKTFEGKTSIDNKNKGEEVELSLGENYYTTGKTTLVDKKEYGKDLSIREYEEEIEIKNNGDKEYNIKVSLNMPYYAKWVVLSSDMDYKKENNKIYYEFKLPAGETKKINIKVRVSYE